MLLMTNRCTVKLLRGKWLKCVLQAEKEVSELTNELQRVEDELDAAESRLADINLQLEQVEQQADENER